MAVDILRGGGSRSHFLLASFALLCLFLLFNWWSLSTDNLDLLKQIESLTQHLKSSSSVLDQCRHDRSALENRVKKQEDETQSLVQKLDYEKQEFGKLASNFEGKTKEFLVSQKKLEDANSSWNMCVTELESLKKVDLSKDGVIASMRIEKSDLIKQIQELKDQVLKIRNELAQVKKGQNIFKKNPSSTASVPSQLENEGENEVKNLPEPYRAEEKELEHMEHKLEKDDQPQEDERELEMQDNGEKGTAI